MFIRELHEFRAQEQRHLDFKLKAGLPRKNPTDPYVPVEYITDNDREKIAEGISGFANTEGGVLVWGIGCDNPGGTDIDAVTALVPLKNPKRFYGDIQVELHKLTEPTVHCKLHIVFEETDPPFQEGYVILYVPPSKQSVIRAKLPATKKKPAREECFVRRGCSMIKLTWEATLLLMSERVQATAVTPQPVKSDEWLLYKPDSAYYKILVLHKDDVQLAQLVREAANQKSCKDTIYAARRLLTYYENAYGPKKEAIIHICDLIWSLCYFDLLETEGYPYLDRAVTLAEELGLHDTLEYGGLLHSQADTYAVRFPEQALSLLQKAASIIEKNPPQEQSPDLWTPFKDLKQIKEDLAEPDEWVKRLQTKYANDHSNRIYYTVPPELMGVFKKESDESNNDPA